MGYSVREIIGENRQPLSVKEVDSLQVAIDLMAENDFSQLPVVDNLHVPVGMITSDSIIRALNHFRLTTEKLRVKDAMNRKIAIFDPDDDLFDLLDELTQKYAVLIEDGSKKLVGIITSYDATLYFRRRAEDMMLVEDIETAIREHIQIAFEEDENALQTALGRATRSNGISFDKVSTAIKTYISKAQLPNQEVDKLALKLAFESVQDTRRQQKSFQELSFYEYMQLLLSKEKWSSYKEVFGGIDGEALRQLLDEVREIRNSLAHFRGEISPRQHARLQFVADWFGRNKPATKFRDTGGASMAAHAGAQDVFTSSSNSTIDEEQSSEDSKYAPLAQKLLSQSADIDNLTLSFGEIEEVIGNKLPNSAREHRSWWTNDRAGHSQSKQWTEVGWRVSNVDLETEKVQFDRIHEREMAYNTFFKNLFLELKKQTNLQLNTSTDNGLSWRYIMPVTINNRNCAWYAFSFARRNRIRVELYIDSGNKERNKRLFDILESYRSDLETRFQTSISWERLDEKTTSRIAIYKSGSIEDTSSYQIVQAWAIETFINFQKAFAPLIPKSLD